MMALALVRADAMASVMGIGLAWLLGFDDVNNLVLVIFKTWFYCLILLGFDVL